MKFCGECGGALALKCRSCGFENLRGMKFCGECGKSLADPAAPVRSPAPRSYTPKHLAEKILTSRSTLEGERKQVTVLFADVKGSMDLSESIDPEDWHRIMERFFKILTDGVHRFEGTVNQYTGDGIMALFGAPIAHEDHAARACYAALALQEDLRRYANELRIQKVISFSVRMGLNSGEVVVGKIGDDLRMDYTALGHTASLGARMEQIAEPGKCYLTEHTAKLVEGLVALKSLGRLEIKGVREPLGVHELQGIGPLRTRLEVARTRGFSPFVGRDREMATLESALERALEGKAQMVGIVGEPGVGKSRLCSEFLERCRERGLAIFQAHGVSHGKAIPLLPMLELFRNFFAITDQDSAQAAREKIVGRLVPLDESLREFLPLIFDLLGVADPERPAPPMDPASRQRQLHAVVKRVTQMWGRRQPAVTFLEDLHWFDGASEGFLEPIVEALPGTHGLVLVNFRPGYHAAWMQKSYYQQLPLLPLGPEAIAELLRDLLGTDPSLATLADRIQERTGGNPFFIEEVVQALAETGSLEGTKGAYRLARPAAELSLPLTVQAVLAARIDRLAEREKGVLQTAAVIGREFTEPILRRVVELPETELAAALQRLTAAEFIYEEALGPEPEYTFKHPLTQEVANRSQLGERRERLHAEVARAIADLYRDRLDEKAALLAQHWEASGDALEAARWHDRAARWAARSHVMEAVQHWRKVRALVQRAADSFGVADLDLRACLGLLTVASLGLAEEEARVLYSAGKDLATRKGDLRTLARLSSAYAFFLVGYGLPEESLRYGEESLALAERLDDPWLKLTTREGLLRASIWAGRLQRGLSVAEEGLELSEAELERTPPPADTLRYGRFRAILSYWKGEFLCLLGRPKEAEGWFNRAIAFARETGDLVLLTYFHPDAAVLLYAMLGDAGAMLRHAREAVQAAERLEAPAAIANAYRSLGHASLLSRAYGDALAAFERALAVQEGFEFKPFILTGLAWTHLALGDGETALKTAREAANVTRRLQHKLAEFFAQLCVARVLLSTRGLVAREEIESALQTAAETAAEMGARGLEPDVLIERARLARLLGDEGRYRGELSEAHRLLSEMGATRRTAELERELGLFSDKQ
jgi:class 3 adenylate cyclase/tetratricopeptide (TPR) repeat protein/DNA-binding IscR family transcriptional regulator